MVELRCAAEEQRPSLEELLTQCLSCSQGIRATPWDTEEKLWQLWHHDAQLSALPWDTGERRDRSSLGWHGGASPSLSDINPINDPRGI